MIYAILYHPGHNRVYFETSLKLSVSEFQIAAQRFHTGYDGLCRRNIGGIDYLAFQTREDLSPEDIKIISGLSFVYALFQMEEVEDAYYLKPVVRIREPFVDEGIGAMLKYTGKTNEIFTRMMINVAACSQENRETLRLLDPIAGKGTTLYEGLAKGYNVYGIEIGGKAVNESYHFIKRFLETAKYKFDCRSIKISGPNKSFSALRHTFETAKTKEDFKGGNTRTIEFIAGNSLYANRYYRKNFFDIIVGDLPYGVQHGNVTHEKQSSLTRNPSELLNVCLPSWTETLKPGGIIVLAWNSNTLSRQRMADLLEKQGLEVKNDAPYLQFEHRVDQSIVRDVIAAQKRGNGKEV